MSLDARLRPRPLSPHLAIYRLTSTLAQYLAEDGVKYEVLEHPFTVTALDCTPQVRHDNYSDRHFEDDLWQHEERPVSFRRRTN
jgi:hypothetical protein